jgi:MarR family 2-MHQ and catechol resistance regulon transcriptional repressor
VREEAAYRWQPGRLREPAVMAWMRLMRVYRQVSRAAFCPLRAAGLTTSQFAVIAKIGASEGIAQQELAGSLSVTQGNASQLLAKLEARGLVIRHQAGRSNRLSLSERGRRLYEEVVPAHEARISEQFAVLSTSERNQLLGLLQKLDRATR